MGSRRSRTTATPAARRSPTVIARCSACDHRGVVGPLFHGDLIDDKAGDLAVNRGIVQANLAKHRSGQIDHPQAGRPMRTR